MALTKPNQQLRRDLKEAAALLKWSGVDLMQAAVRLSEAGQEEEARELLKIAASYQDAEDKLAGYADEVKSGKLMRTNSRYGLTP
ncbi:hypothetical protein [Pseudomonas paracarnis]|uniref:hypothetical protein n=1 Tax=Pseudomonas paracarnis TaxID=2750625 RepID=UPI0023DF5750|nr:hypothetical protein [Pseudomonas paracarnis]MDF3188058.1 hypothetical protein [Pseudomonas paracarnis]